MQETQVRSLGQEDPPEKEMATHLSILAWEIHGQRSVVGHSPGSQRVRHHGVTEHLEGSYSGCYFSTVAKLRRKAYSQISPL